MVASASFAEFLKEQLALLGPIALRRMFGKTGVFCDGVMLGMVRDNTLYFRVDDHNKAAFAEAAALPPLNYEKRGETIDLAFGPPPSACSTSPTSWSPGRASRSPPRAASPPNRRSATRLHRHPRESARKRGSRGR